MTPHSKTFTATKAVWNVSLSRPAPSAISFSSTQNAPAASNPAMTHNQGQSNILQWTKSQPIRLPFAWVKRRGNIWQRQGRQKLTDHQDSHLPLAEQPAEANFDSDSRAPGTNSAVMLPYKPAACALERMWPLRRSLFRDTDIKILSSRQPSARFLWPQDPVCLLTGQRRSKLCSNPTSLPRRLKISPSKQLREGQTHVGNSSLLVFPLNRRSA